MADNFTDDKIGALLQGTGDNENDWGARCNDETITPLAKAIAGYLEKDVAGNLDVTLTASEARNAYIKLTGTLTGDIDVIVPTKVGGWRFWNATSGDFDITVKTSAGTGVVVPQDGRVDVWCDETDVIPAGSTTIVAASGKKATIAAEGPDSNIDINIVPKGTGQVLIAGSSLVPTGSVLPFAGSTAPDGWLECYGQAVSRTDYAALFAVIGTRYGEGDGSTTFNLPDLRGRAVFGKDDMGGSAASRVTEAVSGITGTTLGETGGDQRLQQHNHTVSGNTGSGGLHGHPARIDNKAQVTASSHSGGGFMLHAELGVTANYPAYTGTPEDQAGRQIGGGGVHSHSISLTSANSGSGGSQNMPPAIILNYIIKT